MVCVNRRVGDGSRGPAAGEAAGAAGVGRAGGRAACPDCRTKAWWDGSSVRGAAPQTVRLAMSQRFGGPRPDRSHKRQRRLTAPLSNQPILRPVIWSEREDSNLRPLVPQTSALTGLRYAPTRRLIEALPPRCNAPDGHGRQIFAGTKRRASAAWWVSPASDGGCRSVAFSAADLLKGKDEMSRRAGKVSERMA